MVFLEIFQKTPVSETLLKKKLWHRCFPVNFAKFLRTPFCRIPPDDCFCILKLEKKATFCDVINKPIIYQFFKAFTDLVQKTTPVTTRANTAQQETTRVQHEPTTQQKYNLRQHDTTRDSPSKTQDNTRQHEYNTIQHEYNTTQHEYKGSSGSKNRALLQIFCH